MIIPFSVGSALGAAPIANAGDPLGHLNPYSAYLQPLPYYHPYYPPYYMPYVPPPPGYMHPHAPPQVPAHAPGGNCLAIQPPLLSRIVTTNHDISLTEFCAEYGIHKSDEEKLRKLQYRPGDCNVDEKDLREIALLTRLGWDFFLDAHRRFCTAMKARCK